jgi:hypothetical protein
VTKSKDGYKRPTSVVERKKNFSGLKRPDLSVAQSKIQNPKSNDLLAAKAKGYFLDAVGML